MKRILVLNFFPAFVPPSSGGELRYYNMYARLSAFYDITLLSPTYADHKPEVIRHSDTFREYRIPKEESIHYRLHNELDSEAVCSEVSALVCAMSSAYPNDYHAKYLELYHTADIIVHESPFMVEYDLLWGFDDKPRVYNSYNIEYSLFSQLCRGDKAKVYIDYIFSLEKKTATESDLVFATSEEERQAFVDLFGVSRDKIALAPNGTNTQQAVPAGRRDKNTAFFIGSQHPPNIEAAAFLIEKVAPRCAGIEFMIAGSCGDYFRNKPLSKNVRLLGKVDDQTKRDLFDSATIALAPLFSGAGTNLKTLEYLSFGIPLVSTDVGMRGLDFEDGKHYIRASRKDFPDKIMRLIADETLRENISRSGHQRVQENYSWERITQAVRNRLDALPSRRQKIKKRLLVMNDFGVASPGGGGEVRINRLYSALSRRCDVVLLCLNNSQLIGRARITPSFSEVSFPKTPEHRDEEAKMNSMYWVSAADILSSSLCSQNRLYCDALKAFHEAADVIVLVHPYMLPALNGLTGKPIVYESLNFEEGLKKTILEGHPLYTTLVQQVELVEREASRLSSLVFGVTTEDLDQLVRVSGIHGDSAHLIRNGVEVRGDDFFSDQFDEVKALLHGHPSVLFMGSGHSPNVTALNFIIQSLAPALPHCYFLIIGTVCDAPDRHTIPKNILLFGRVSEAEKEALLKITDLAINPMAEGSGSNLKLAEYLAFRIPTVTTPMGARGYDVTDGKEVVIAKLKDFADRVRLLLEDHVQRRLLSANGYSYALRNLDWRILSDEYFSVLERTLFRGNKKRLLVLTYRFTLPPLGGAEIYLLNVLREIDRLGNFAITVCTLDIHAITNKYHFSSEYTYDFSVPLLHDMPNTSVYKLRCDRVPDDDKLNNARLLYRRWMEESVDCSLRHAGKYTSPILMGGWHFPEGAAGHYDIWSSDSAYIFIAGSEEIDIEGYRPFSAKISLAADGITKLARTINGHFKMTVPTAGARWLQISLEGFSVANDPRTLGVRIGGIRYKTGGRWKDLRLDYHFRDYLKDHCLEEYLEDLIRTAESRPPEIDALFQHTRGPVSRELEGWLEKNVRHFDIVLGHSIPFSTSVMASTYARKYGKPVLILPHFHIDDNFYHWASYYAALRNATAVLAFPKRSIDLFYSKIEAVSHYIHGGAVHLEEHANFNKAVFSREYNDGLPFFLVLGRKAGSKNYRLAMDAVKAINRNGKVCNLVIIGRDEDGESVDGQDVVYLGERDRDSVLGALHECAALINMSESESFGIVILEAWMQKKPVIVNKRCAAFAELVEDGVNGLLATRDNLADMIRLILEKPSQARKLGAKGFQKVSEEFTWQAIAKDANRLFLKEVTEAVKADSQAAPHACDIEEEIRNIRNLHAGGFPHEPDFLFFKNLPAEDGLFLDVGANAGQSAVSFRCVDKSRQILSLEPNYLFKPVLQFVKEKLVPRFDYMLCGLGDRNTTLLLTVPYVDDKPYFQESSIDRAQFEKPWVKNRLASYGTHITFKEMDIQLIAADDLKLHPDVVKIDAEGFELSVLRGMKDTISVSHPVFLIENNDYVHVTGFLRSLGYEVFVYDADTNRLQPPGSSANCFYLHSSHHLALIKALAE